MKLFSKYLILWLLGGLIYYGLELLYRGYSHWTMFVLGGICFISIGLINELFTWEMLLWKQSITSGLIVILLEFITGCIVNLWLKWNVWNYTKFDVLGQICIPFFFLWCLLSVVAIMLDDWIRYFWFKEERPRYKLF